MTQNGDFRFLLLRVHIASSTGRYTPTLNLQYRHLVAKNDDLGFLLLELILTDQLADTTLVEASSGQEW